MINVLVLLFVFSAYAQADTNSTIQTIEVQASPVPQKIPIIIVHPIVQVGGATATAHAGAGALADSTNLNLNSNSISNNIDISITQRVMQKMSQEISFITNELQNRAPAAKQALYDNKFKIIGAGLLGLYGHTWYKLIALSHKVAAHDNWHTYKNDLSFEELLQVPQNGLAQELVGSIQQAYAAQAVESFFTPFIFFVKDIDQEITNLEQLIAVQKRIQKLRVSKLFPWEKVSQKDAHMHLQRALYLKNVVLTWLSTFKMESNTKKLSV